MTSNSPNSGGVSVPGPLRSFFVRLIKFLGLDFFGQPHQTKKAFIVMRKADHAGVGLTSILNPASPFPSERLFFFDVDTYEVIRYAGLCEVTSDEYEEGHVGTFFVRVRMSWLDSERLKVTHVSNW